MSKTKLETLIKKITEFNQIRGWRSSPQNIAKSVVIEAAELLEHFQWDNAEKTGLEDKDITEIKYEVADVFWYLVNFCNESGIDLSEAVELKMAHNEIKYPQTEFPGKHNDEFYKAQKKKYRQQKTK